ncbi:MAG: hypothetical protein PHX27_02465 [Candidatus ainarchaeum sp.]|nr:hypothetical protein [Candidatus ainarchaeum sp.]
MENEEITEKERILEKELDEKDDNLKEIIINLRKKMAEIDQMTIELEKKRLREKGNNPVKTKRLLEELKVPALELLK